MNFHKIVLPLGFAGALTMGSALAVDTTPEPEPTETTQECTDGKVWDSDKGECVVASLERFNDDQLFEFGREFAYAGQFDNAISVLMKSSNLNDPKILNYLGFSHRKAGRIEVGLGYYREALSRDPDYVLARSYMGQAFAEMGHISLAHQQLDEIGRRVGNEAYAYVALAQSIAERRAY